MQALQESEVSGQVVNGKHPMTLRLEALREALALNKREFADRIGVAPNTYSLYAGGRPPSTDVLEKVAKLTGVNMHWLFTGVGEMRAKDMMRVSDLPPDTETLHKECEALRRRNAELESHLVVSRQGRQADDSAETIAELQAMLAKYLNKNIEMTKKVAELETALATLKR